MADTTSDRSRRAPADVPWVPGFVVLAALVGLALCTRYARHYFFLFDDYALVGIAGTSSIGEILRTPFFGFVRPVPFLIAKTQFAISGWTSPAFFELVAIATHTANGVLLYALGRELGLRRAPAAAAAAVFIQSAWAAEAYLWLSGAFDRLATAGILGACFLALRAARAAGTTSAILLLTGASAAALIALLSKEVAAAIVVIVLAAILAGRHPQSRWRMAACCGALAVLTAGYLLWRRFLLPGLGGAYGNWAQLLSSADLVANAWTYLRGVCGFPLPYEHLDPRVAAIAAAVPAALACAWAAVLFTAVLHRPKLAACCVLCYLVLVLPVIWHPLSVGTSAGGRFLYPPGAWLALTIGIALETNTRAKYAAGAAALIIALANLWGISHQLGIWRQAARLAESSIVQVRARASSSQPLLVENLPAMYVEGPYVLKDYAFEFYFAGQAAPRVRSRPMILRSLAGRTYFAGWADEPGQSSVALPGETPIRLSLDVERITPKPQVDVEFPARGGSVAQPFVMRGRALDLAYPGGCGIDVVHVYAFAQGKQEPLFVGPAAVGRKRGDEGCDWQLHVAGLPPGRYLLAVHGRALATSAFLDAVVVSVALK